MLPPACWVSSFPLHDANHLRNGLFPPTFGFLSEWKHLLRFRQLCTAPARNGDTEKSSAQKRPCALGHFSCAYHSLHTLTFSTFTHSRYCWTESIMSSANEFRECYRDITQLDQCNEQKILALSTTTRGYLGISRCASPPPTTTTILRLILEQQTPPRRVSRCPVQPLTPNLAFPSVGRRG